MLKLTKQESIFAWTVTACVLWALPREFNFLVFMLTGITTQTMVEMMFLLCKWRNPNG